MHASKAIIVKTYAWQQLPQENGRCRDTLLQSETLQSAYLEET